VVLSLKKKHRDNFTFYYKCIYYAFTVPYEMQEYVHITGDVYLHLSASFISETTARMSKKYDTAGSTLGVGRV